MWFSGLDNTADRKKALEHLDVYLFNKSYNLAFVMIVKHLWKNTGILVS